MNEDQPSESPLTPQARHIYELLSEAGKWVGRAELATKLGKSTLNKWDIALLARLTALGLIESRKIPYHGPIGYEWQYRAKPNMVRLE